MVGYQVTSQPGLNHIVKKPVTGLAKYSTGRGLSAGDAVASDHLPC